MSRKSTVAFFSFVAAAQAAAAASLPFPMPLPVEIVNPEPGAGDVFGSSISISGNRFAVGASQHDTNGVSNSGKVFVFARQAGQWVVETAAPMPGDPGVEDWFASVALQGPRLLVGASRKASGIGAGYLFERGAGDAWVQRAKFLPDSPSSGCGDSVGCHLFAGDVALDGDTAVFSAHTESTRRGAVYVFTRSAQGVWGRTARLTASDAAPHSQFGNAVALDGGTIVVGAHQHTVGGRGSQGAAYVYTRDAQGAWSQQSRLIASDGAGGDVLGFSVAVDGDTAIAGARAHQSRRGAAYVFKRQGVTWNFEAKLLASDGVAGDQFGYSVLILGDDAFIGKYPGDGSTPASDRNGAVYRFRRTGTVWAEVEHFTPPSGSPGDAFGAALALNDRALVVGASFEGTTPGEVADRGAVYVYDVTPTDRIFADDFEF